MSMEEDISNMGAKLTQVGATLTQLTDDQYNANIDIEDIDRKTPTQGQTTMANSSPVVIASDQTAIPVTGAFSVVGGATSANQTNGTQRTQITDGVDNALVTAAGELNTLATAQPGVDIGDVTVNNAAGAAAVNIQDGGNSITVDGTVAVSNFPATQPVSGTVAVSNFPATQPVSGTVTANQGTAAATAGAWPTKITDGTDIALVTAAGEQNVISTAQPGVDIGDVTVNNAAGAAAVNIQDGGNSITVDGTVAVSNFPAINMVQGDVANDTVDSGNPVKIGGVARTTNPTPVSHGDRVDGMYSKLGKKVVIIGSVRELVVQNTVTLTTTTETTLLAAGAAGVFHDITNMFVANTSGGSRRIDFRDATGGTVRFSINVGANVSNTTALPIQIMQTTSANNWTVQMDANAVDVRIFAGAIKTL